MAVVDEFQDIIKRNEPLAPYTYLRLGGPAEMLAQPRSREELSRFVRRCFEERVPLRILGSGCNLLVRDEGVRGAVVRLVEPPFVGIAVEGHRIRAGTGGAMSSLIAEAARHGLSGLETLVGIPGTVGGALRFNAGDRSGDMGQCVRQVEVMDSSGAVQVRDRDELRFGDHVTNLDDPVLLSVEFALETDRTDAIVKRMRKAWIVRKSSQPLTSQAAGRIFKNPPGLNASALIEQTGLSRTRLGGAEVSDRDANCIVVDTTATSRDVLRLIDLIRSRVQEKLKINLEQELTVW
jgi:UDP-N-acetylmuramate dehydrogenase